jgi:mono/diheme cytochrome c family protein
MVIRSRAVSLACALGALALLAGCEQQMANMYQQPKLKPLQESPLWPDGRASRPLEPYTIVYSGGAFADSSSGRLQIAPLPTEVPPTLPVNAEGEPKIAARSGPLAETNATNPLPRTLAVLKRGQERFGIFCAPCHGFAGHGDGMVARRGFPNPPSYHIDRLRNAPDAHFFDVITNGYGAMYPYADRVPPNDRWAIVAYIRALQLSQHATLDAVPETQRRALEQSSGDAGVAP